MEQRFIKHVDNICYYSRRYDFSKSRNREYEWMLDIADS